MNAENVGQILDALGVRFGATGAHLWTILQRQAYVEGVIALLAIGLGSIMFAAFSWTTRKARDDYNYEPVMVGIGISGVIVVICAVIQTFGAISAMMNPEYYALQQVLGAFK